MTKPRGFAAMTPERRKEIAAKGGRGAPPDKRPFALDRALASQAGKIGGSVKKNLTGDGEA